MNRIVAIVLVILIAVSMVGCGFRQPSPGDIASADYGPYPENYKEVIEEYMADALVDSNKTIYLWSGSPHTYKYEWTSKPKAVWRNVLGVIHYGWEVQFVLSAKSLTGESVGAQKETVLIKFGRVIARGRFMGGARDQSAARVTTPSNLTPAIAGHEIIARQIVLAHVKYPQMVKDLIISPLVEVRQLDMGFFKDAWDGQVCLITYREPEFFSGEYDLRYITCRMLLFKNGRPTGKILRCPSWRSLWPAQKRAGAKRHELLDVIPENLLQVR